MNKEIEPGLPMIELNETEAGLEPVIVLGGPKMLGELGYDQAKAEARARAALAQVLEEHPPSVP